MADKDKKFKLSEIMEAMNSEMDDMGNANAEDIDNPENSNANAENGEEENGEGGDLESKVKKAVEDKDWATVVKYANKLKKEEEVVDDENGEATNSETPDYEDETQPTDNGEATETF